MNFVLALVFGLIRTPALIYYVVTGVVIYVITNLLRIVFLPLRFLNTNMPGVYGLGLSLFIIIAATHGFLYLKSEMQPLLDSQLFVTVPTILLTIENMGSATLEGFYMLKEAVPKPDVMFNWTKTYLFDWDIRNIFIGWWVILASQFGPIIYYLSHRFFYVIGMED
ncbi:hypothetical protein OCT63_18390, partial [Vibrio sp. RW]|uniref:hypothetical protein n=1 Tax=Vibrio sp. RW TaxID=2998833 RepID=UPI0022CD5DBB